MTREPFLVRFAERVVARECPTLKYDPHARRSRLTADGPFVFADVTNGTYLTETREQKDHAEHASFELEGTIITATSESKDHVEDDRVLCTSLEPRDALGLVGTKKSGGDEQTDPSDDRRDSDATMQAGQYEHLLTLIGTKKTDSREQSDPADDGGATYVAPIHAPDRGRPRFG